MDKSLIDLIMATYTDEPCRVCGKNITMADIKAGAVFAGYSKDCSSRSAHKECWEKNVQQEKWAIQ